MGTIVAKVARSSQYLALLQERSHSRWVLTAEAGQYLERGSPEGQVHAAVPPGGIPLSDLKKQLGAVADLGFAHAKRLKWLDIDKSQGAPMVVRMVGTACCALR